MIHKALRKAASSVFCSFAKFETRPVMNFFECNENIALKSFQKNSQNTHSESNFNRIYNYNYAIQGLNSEHVYIPR